MRLLLLSSQFPYPPHAGGALRSYGLISGLHAAGHELDLLTFVEPDQTPPDATPLGALCSRIVTVPAPRRSGKDRLRDLLLSDQADMTRRFYAPDYARILDRMLSERPYDLVQIESLEMCAYLPQITARKQRVIYDALNAESDLQRLIYTVDRRSPSRWHAAFYSFLQWRRLQKLERQVCASVDGVVAVSDADADLLRKLVPGVKIAVVPNGIYTAEYLPAPTKQLDLGGAALLFTGTMDYRPNVDAMIWFVESVLDEVRAAVPEVKLFIVGKSPHTRLGKLRDRADVQITGYVQDVAPFLHSASVYVAPLRMGSGTRLKLLQAMAAGCAIVSTRIGAQGLNVSNGREMILADEATSFAQGVVALLRDPEGRKRLGTAAQSLACAEYDWSAIVPKLSAFYEELGLG
ncbi:MAG: glycosyltransferase [Anaerolinea sp.]|nr:glycosyltransferase [Anaerolinea sp.]MCC6973650.1 glycosyltransferase [Anaerolineae bacterium]